MIPKTIHYLWLSENKTPEIEMCVSTWREHLKGYEIKEWNKTNFPYWDFIWTREAFMKEKWAFVTDFFRLWVLENYGGIYMDADVTVTGSFDSFLHQPMFIGTEFTDQIAAHVIGAEKGHPFIQKCLKYYENRHFIMNNGELDMKPMPNIITKIFMQQYNYDGILVNFDGTPININDMRIYSDTYFTINTYDGNNVCYHNGLGSWRDKTTTPNPVMEDVIRRFLVKKHIYNSIRYKYKGIKKLIFFLMPIGLIFLKDRYYMHIKNNKRVKSVKI